MHRTTISDRPTQDFGVATSLRCETSIFIPGTAIQSSPLQDFQVTMSSHIFTHALIPRTASDTGPPQNFKMSKLCRSNTHARNPIAAVGIEPGDSSVKDIKIVAYATSPAAEEELRGAWESAIGDSPVYQTLAKACSIETKLVLM